MSSGGTGILTLDEGVATEDSVAGEVSTDPLSATELEKERDDICCWGDMTGLDGRNG